ncbi:hypothetical protein DC498_00740 [Terrimonas sp.]|nr:hypothetical protein DC498_00740 [Terrimonas sp.]
MKNGIILPAQRNHLKGMLTILKSLGMLIFLLFLIFCLSLFVSLSLMELRLLMVISFAVCFYRYLVHNAVYIQAETN